MNHDLIPWDAADYLASDSDIADYLTAAFETGEATDISHALATISRARAKTAISDPGDASKAAAPGR